MEIAFIGNFEAEFSTENYHKKSFESLGVEIIPIQENRTNMSQVIDSVLKADMLYWTHTHGWKIGSDSDIKMMFKMLKEKNIPSVGYHLDLWLGLRRERDLHSDPYWGIQHFFTVDKLMADWLNTNTETKGYFLPAGVYEGECFLGKPDREKYPHDVIFTGSKGYHSEYPYRAQLIDWLHQTYGSRFAHYGGGGLPTVRGPELNNLYASAKVVVGDTLCKGFKYEEYLSDRAFEVPGRGGFMIFPYIKGIERHYELGEEIVTYQYGNFDDLASKIDFYLNNEDQREKILKGGFERVKKDHTYGIRIKRILETIL